MANSAWAFMYTEDCELWTQITPNIKPNLVPGCFEYKENDRWAAFNSNEQIALTYGIYRWLKDNKKFLFLFKTINSGKTWEILADFRDMKFILLNLEYKKSVSFRARELPPLRLRWEVSDLNWIDTWTPENIPGEIINNLIEWVCVETCQDRYSKNVIEYYHEGTLFKLDFNKMTLSSSIQPELNRNLRIVIL